MNTLSIDIGGTKFSMAVFCEDRMVLRKTQATNQNGGSQWMLDQINVQVKEWQKQIFLDHCGVGFGGPVRFDRQEVVCSMHVSG